MLATVLSNLIDSMLNISRRNNLIKTNGILYHRYFTNEMK